MNASDLKGAWSWILKKILCGIWETLAEGGLAKGGGERILPLDAPFQPWWPRCGIQRSCPLSTHPGLFTYIRSRTKRHFYCYCICMKRGYLCQCFLLSFLHLWVYFLHKTLLCEITFMILKSLWVAPYLLSCPSQKLTTSPGFLPFPFTRFWSSSVDLAQFLKFPHSAQLPLQSLQQVLSSFHIFFY